MELPNELLIDILLQTKTKKELINLCKTSKKLYTLCQTEQVSKHIITNLIRLEKPDVFLTYRGFLKHYIKYAEILNQFLVYHNIFQ